MIEIRTVRAFRESDAEEIFILSKLTLDDWVMTVDTLVDSEFKIIPINLVEYYLAQWKQNFKLLGPITSLFGVGGCQFLKNLKKIAPLKSSIALFLPLIFHL